jgi:hypothetical protein
MEQTFDDLGLLLLLPIGILLPSIWLDVAIVRDLVTVSGDRPNVFGLTLIVGVLLLLPGAFVVALLPMTWRRLHAVNLLVCAVIAIPMATTLYGIGEEIYRCEVRGIPNCD